MTEEMYRAYDEDGHYAGEHRSPEEAEAAARRANEFARREAAEVAAEHKLLSVKPTEDDKLRAKALGPGLHLSVDQPTSRRGRSSAMGRGISVVPYGLVNLALVIIAIPVTIVAWIALLITGEYPSLLFAYNTQMVRFLVRVVGYMYLVTDVRPPLSGASKPLYPIQLDINPPRHYNRTVVALRLPLLVPLAIANLAATVLAILTLTVSMAIVYLTKHQLGPLQAIMKFCLRVYAQFLASATLLTPEWWLTSASVSEVD